MEGIMCENNRELMEYVITRKTNPPPFLVKTYMLVDDPATDPVVSWNEGGTAFVVWQPADLARDLLPTLFKHCNFSSFVRQLNTYGFKKVATTRWEFYNDNFQRGKREMLGQIRRRKAWSNRQQPPPPPTTMTMTPSESGAPQNHEDDQRSSSSSSSSELSTLVDENKRLKKENGVLSSELTTMKKKCKELLELVATYTSRKEERERNREEDEEEKRPKLFGVRLDVHGEGERKRKRSTEIYETARPLLSQSCK